MSSESKSSISTISTSIPESGVSIFKFGSPYVTGAFVQPLKEYTWKDSTLPKFCKFTSSQGSVLNLSLHDDDSVVGLGQHVGGVNCRGRVFRLFSSDNPLHIPSMQSMYGAHPFFMILGQKNLGVFVDTAAEVIFDVGSSKRDEITIKLSAQDFNLMFIEGDSPGDIVEKFLKMVGRPYLPPLWAFGYHQSRWSYPDQESVKNIATMLEHHQIPCDSIHIDIHYMDNYKVFTVNKKRFKDLPKLSSDLKEQGIKLVSIIDPGVKLEEGYPVYDEGIAKGFFCKKSNSNDPFVGVVWAGLSVFPDFFRADVQQWWGEKYLKLKDLGIEGFWNDMNEPAIFYTPESFSSFAKTIADFEKAGAHTEELANLLFDKKVCGIEDHYDQFTHQIDGKSLVHRDVHNLYGTKMTQATALALQNSDPRSRYFLLSRSSYIGMHRYAAIWTGDNHSWWEHLELNIQMLISLNSSGFMFCGADIGGFSGDCSPELLIRWTQLGVFSPFFRNHSALWARNQEPWAFDDETVDLCRRAIRLRYALMPYLYSEFARSVFAGRPFIRGVFFDYPSERRELKSDTFLCGSALLVAPVIKPGVGVKEIVLPSGPWLKLDLKGDKNSVDISGKINGDVKGESLYHSGYHSCPVSISDIPAFLKVNTMVCVGKVTRSTATRITDSFKLIGFTDSTATCEILLDDGVTDYQNWKDFPKVKVTLINDGSNWKIETDFESIPPQAITFKIEAWNTNSDCVEFEHTVKV